MAYKKTSAMNLFNSALPPKTEEKEIKIVKEPKVVKEKTAKEKPVKEPVKEKPKTKRVEEEKSPVIEDLPKPDEVKWVSSSLHIDEENAAFMKKWSAFSGKTQKDLFYEIFTPEYEKHKDEVDDLNASFDLKIDDKRKKTRLFGIQLPETYMQFMTRYTALCGINKSVYVDYLITKKRKSM